MFFSSPVSGHKINLFDTTPVLFHEISHVITVIHVLVHWSGKGCDLVVEQLGFVAVLSFCLHFGGYATLL